jgi:hypothetical protein
LERKFFFSCPGGGIGVWVGTSADLREIAESTTKYF